jgi:hypothetical protein
MIKLYKDKGQLGRVQALTQSKRSLKLRILVPFKGVLQPRFGEFLLVRTSDDRAVVLRIDSCEPAGTLTSNSGEEYQVALVVRNAPLSDNIREEHLWYVYEGYILGAIDSDSELTFTPGLRTSPHVGAQVWRASDEVLNFLANIGTKESDPVIGRLSLGSEIAFLSDDKSSVPVRFDLTRLISKRTFVFSRAGYGKSNFVKLLITRLREQLVSSEHKCGILVFDPEGEYAFSTKAGLPGFADLQPFTNGLVVFTNRTIRTEFYQRFVGGNIKIDLRVLDPREVAEILFPTVSSDPQWKNIMTAFAGRNQRWWRHLIDQVHSNETIDFDYYKERINQLSSYGANSFMAFLRRLQHTVHQLHSPESSLLDKMVYHLKMGSVVVVDISILSDAIAGHIIELCLKKVFEYNQMKFMAEEDGNMITTVVVVEEAQNSLGTASMDETSPIVRWAKEGRKYNLGGIYITQQPSALAKELLSQGDNYFAMHLINHADLDSLNKVNAHFAEDVLTYLLNEPIKGNAYFWSAPYQPYVLNVQIDQFENGVVRLTDDQKAQILAKGDSAFATEEYAVKEKAARQEFAKQLRLGRGLYSVEDGENLLATYTKGRKALAIHPFFARQLLGEVLRGFKGLDDLLETSEDGARVATESLTLQMLNSLGWILDPRLAFLKHYGGKKAGWTDYMLLLDKENVKLDKDPGGVVIPEVKEVESANQSQSSEPTTPRRGRPRRK